MISPQTGLIVLLIVLVLFGGKRIPELMGGLGKGLRSFKKAMEGEDVPEDVPPLSASASPPPPTSTSTSTPAANAAQDKSEQK